MTSILETLATYDVFEWVALITGLLYAIFSVLNKPVAWVFGIVSSACIMYKDFTDYHLIFDGVLQGLYVVMGVIGLWRWRSGNKSVGSKIISIPVLTHVNAIILCSILSLILAFSVKLFFNPNFAIFDAFTTLFSVWATWLLINRVYETWYYWLVINFVYVGLFWNSGGSLVAVLYGFYFFTAIFGLMSWWKIKNVQNHEDLKEPTI